VGSVINEKDAATDVGENLVEPLSPRRSGSRTPFVCGVLGAVAGIAGGTVTCLTLLLWDWLEEGQPAWPTSNEAATAAGYVLAGTLVCALLSAVLGTLVRR
jgi:hypothetical protein